FRSLARFLSYPLCELQCDVRGEVAMVGIARAVELDRAFAGVGKRAADGFGDEAGEPGFGVQCGGVQGRVQDPQLYGDALLRPPAGPRRATSGRGGRPVPRAPPSIRPGTAGGPREMVPARAAASVRIPPCARGAERPGRRPP